MFTIDGLPQLESYLRQRASTLRKDIQEDVGGIFKSELPRMKSDAPVRTGELRNSGKFIMGGGKGILCKIEFSAKHAGFVNFGTIRMRARPFATSGVNRIKSKLRSRFRQ